MDSLTAFIQLFTLTDVAAAQRIGERLALVLRNPEVYMKQYAEELAERGIVGELQKEKPDNLLGVVTQHLFAKSGQVPLQELRDVALIDALWSEELAWENDWKDSLDDMSQYVNETLTKQGRPQLLDEEALSRNISTGPEALDILQDALEPLGLALVLLTLDSDSYPLSVVADAQAEDARRLAKELGFTVTVY